jgi:2'-5' RNA ligase
MEDERLLTVMVTPVGLPVMVERTRWPVHVTVAGNFRLYKAHTNEVSALLNAVANDVAAFDVELGPRDRFGVEHNIPVLLASHPVFHSLHESLAVGLKDMPGFAPAEPSYWEGGYRPHVTLNPALGVHVGDTLSFTTLSLVSLRGSLGQRVSTVGLS